ncbi:hypothetical protein [Variovorax sp. Root318D1]|uniref:hypothetical protein n=1 Tax=Variovorax sp. Root318D1 TaxID=1736513 RepID=UPI000B269C79|nr:hypothetical protein [Variovorax sp. Root318D1]
MSSMSPWLQIAHLFDRDDGSLPDVFVDNLSSEQLVKIYGWVMSQCVVLGNPSTWHVAEEKDIALKAISDPAKAFLDGEIKTFRHGLGGLTINGCVLPLLTISLETPTCISFDYRSGSEWNERTITAFLQFVFGIREQAPNARIWRTDEGAWDRPSSKFTAALKQFEAETKGSVAQRPR